MMRARKLYFLLIPAIFAFTAMACNLASVILPSPTPGLFDTPTTAPSLPATGATGASPSAETPATSTQAPPLVVVPTSTTAAVTGGNASPTPPPTVAITPAQPQPNQNPPAATPVKMATQPPANVTLKIYLIAMNDNGASGSKIGCGDSVVGVNVVLPYTQAVLRASLAQLLSLKSKDYGQSGLYNALYQSNLTIDSLAIQNGEAIIKLKGQLASGGVCDDPRIIAQIERTALQFATVNKVTTYVNGTKIQDLLSGK